MIVMVVMVVVSAAGSVNYEERTTAVSLTRVLDHDTRRDRHASLMFRRWQRAYEGLGIVRQLGDLRDRVALELFGTERFEVITQGRRDRVVS
jgi:hypothetical protein